MSSESKSHQGEKPDAEKTTTGAVVTKEELYKKAKEAGFERKDVDALKNFSKIMASKIVKKYLIDYVEATAKAEGLLEDNKLHGKERKNMKERYRLYKKIIGKLDRIPACDYSGYQEITLTDYEGNDHRLRFQLSIVSKDHEIEFGVPAMPKKEEAVKTLFHYMDRFIDVAIQYYNHIASQSMLIKDLAEFFGNVDVGRFQINKNTRHLYFEEEYDQRVGILVFYVDENGKPLHS